MKPEIKTQAHFSIEVNAVLRPQRMVWWPFCKNASLCEKQRRNSTAINNFEHKSSIQMGLRKLRFCIIQNTIRAVIPSSKRSFVKKKAKRKMTAKRRKETEETAGERDWNEERDINLKAVTKCSCAVKSLEPCRAASPLWLAAWRLTDRPPPHPHPPQQRLGETIF